MDEKTEQNVFLYSRKRLEISGVADVFELTETSVELSLFDGCLGVDGDDLRIEYFSSDTNKVCINGNIRGIVYYSKAFSPKKHKKHRS